jgi:hypothetical protein
VFRDRATGLGSLLYFASLQVGEYGIVCDCWVHLEAKLWFVDLEWSVADENI